jgi:hypothetical protein
MAHYARVNSENIVTYVTPVDNEIITDENGIEREELGVSHLYSTIPDSTGDKWIQTSYNKNFRKHYAGIGFSWDDNLNAFIPPKIYNSWILNTETCEWEPPIPMPAESQIGGPSYNWDETLGNWKPVY